MRRILLVEPAFPISRKSRNHKNYLPIGLLKIASYLLNQDNQVRLIRGAPIDVNKDELLSFNPDEIWITSLFTYWAKYVKESVKIYKEIFPNAYIKVGGIYASLFPPQEIQEYTGCDEVIQGIIPEVEEFTKTHPLAYDLLGKINPHPIDFQIIHASRGCSRKCPFCGTWKIEPEFSPKKSVVNEIQFPGVVFYDNNFLMNPYVENILNELIELRRKGKVRWIESQSGLDGRILVNNPHLAILLKNAGLRYPRIAWDWGYDQKQIIERQLDVLKNAGYKSDDIFVFMIYNHDLSFIEMEKKRITCWYWKIQIADCRYRPLNQLIDNYNSQIRDQNSDDYFISSGWNDALVKQFRKNVRRQNICVRMGYSVYSSVAERKIFDKDSLINFRKIASVEEKIDFLKQNNADWWLPGEISYPYINS